MFPWDLALSVIAPNFTFLLASRVGSCPSSSDAQRFRVREPSRAFFSPRFLAAFPWRAPKLFGRAFVQGCEKASRSDAFLSPAATLRRLIPRDCVAPCSRRHPPNSIADRSGLVRIRVFCIASAADAASLPCREAGHSQSGVQRTSPIGAACLQLTVRREFRIGWPHVTFRGGFVESGPR